MPNYPFIENIQMEIHLSMLYSRTTDVHSIIFKWMDFSAWILPWTLHGYVLLRVFSNQNMFRNIFACSYFFCSSSDILNRSKASVEELISSSAFVYWSLFWSSNERKEMSDVYDKRSSIEPVKYCHFDIILIFPKLSKKFFFEKGAELLLLFWVGLISLF